MSTYPGGRGSSALALQFKHQSHPKAPSQKHPESCLIEHAWPRQIDTENESRARLASVPSTWRPPHLAGSGPGCWEQGAGAYRPHPCPPLLHGGVTASHLPRPLPLVTGAEKPGRFPWGPDLGRERLGLTSAPPASASGDHSMCSWGLRRFQLVCLHRVFQTPSSTPKPAPRAPRTRPPHASTLLSAALILQPKGAAHFGPLDPMR